MQHIPYKRILLWLAQPGTLSCWWTDTMIAPSVHLLVFTLCVIPSPWEWEGQQNTAEVMGCHLHNYVVISVLLDFPYCFLSLHTLMKKVAMLERSTWQRLESNLQPIARKDLQPSVKQSSGNWILPTTWMSLEVDPSQLSFHMRPQLQLATLFQSCEEP